MNKTFKMTNEKEKALYGPLWYQIDKEALAKLKELKPHKPVIAAIFTWFWLWVIIKGYLYLGQPVYIYPIVIFLIAGRAGVFLQLAHEATHRLISKGKFNNWFGDWIASYPLGFDLKGYGDPHLRHHACTNMICDPLSDSEKYKACDIRSKKLWFAFLKDLLGITAISVKLRYDQHINNKYEKHIDDYLETEEGYVTQQIPSSAMGQRIKHLFFIGIVQLLILWLLFDKNILSYATLWLMPLFSVHMFLMRIRGIAEHGLGVQLGAANLGEKSRGLFFTRSFGTIENRYAFPLFTWIERLLIGSLQVYYHHEHHLYPKIPYYNLSKIHKLIHKEVNENNPYIYATGYFACLFMNPNSCYTRSSNILLPRNSLRSFLRFKDNHRRIAGFLQRAGDFLSSK